MVISDTTPRRTRPELMDQPGLDPGRHGQALRALARINTLSFTAHRVWTTLECLRPNGARPLRVLDVACGGGDVAVAVARRAARSGIPLEMHGCDVSDFAVDYARERAEEAGVRASFFRLDVLGADLPEGYDLVCSSLFLHHLSDESAVSVLERMARAGRALLVQDLVRSRVGYVLAWAVPRMVSRSSVAHVDGPRSVEGAFTVSEATTLARRAGLAGAAVTRCWPWRFLMRWRAP
jgi:2-polyprenyl-3-methyl-5-hydroxy-6-metoxy-1,4-benzoquinol methylase